MTSGVTSGAALFPGTGMVAEKSIPQLFKERGCTRGIMRQIFADIVHHTGTGLFITAHLQHEIADSRIFRERGEVCRINGAKLMGYMGIGKVSRSGLKVVAFIASFRSLVSRKVVPIVALNHHVTQRSHKASLLSRAKCMGHRARAMP